MSAFLIAAARKSSGKTTVSLGLCAALTAMGLRVQPFKKGPDYIDPLWLSQAAGRPCHNLDFYTMSPDEIVRSVATHAHGVDVTVIEGNKGLFDGLDVQGTQSNAALAQLLNCPVVLVLDTQGMTRGIAPLILGYQAFEPHLSIIGVILNQVGGSRHEGKLRAAIDYYTNLPVLGAVQKDRQLSITERHLGLMPSNELAQAQLKIQHIAEKIAAQVDLPQLLNILSQYPPLSLPPPTPPIISKTPDIKLGILRDAAFGFYYPGDLWALETAGAELVFIDALQDQQLPEIDGLFIGGGFPETQAAALMANQSLRYAIRHRIEQGLPVYAECGGLMYLSQKLVWQASSWEMVGALPCTAIMEDHPQGRGYVHLRETGQGLWPLPSENGTAAEFRAHEFHYSRIIDLPTDSVFAYQVLRGTGITGEQDGLVYKRVLASYTHLRSVQSNPWPQRFLEFIRRCKLNSL